MANHEENPYASLKGTSKDVKCSLEIGKLLKAALTPEEIEQIGQALNAIISTDRINNESREPIRMNR